MKKNELNTLPLFNNNKKENTDAIANQDAGIQKVATVNETSTEPVVELQEQLDTNQQTIKTNVASQGTVINNVAIGLSAITEIEQQVEDKQEEISPDDIAVVGQTGNEVPLENVETILDNTVKTQVEIIKDSSTTDSAIDNTDALQKYAEKINVLVEHLREKWKVTANAFGGISIPYLDENEEVTDTKVIDKDGQVTWEQGAEPIVYGEWRVPKYTNDYIVIVPDDANAHVLWANSIQAIAITQNNLTVDIGLMLRDFKEIYVLRNGSDFTDLLYSRLQNIVDKKRLYSIDAPNFEYKDFVELNVKGELSIDTIKKQKFKLVPIPPVESKENLHVFIGEKVIEKLKLIYFEDDLYSYKNGVYSIINDKDIASYILKFIKPEAKSSLCKHVIYYIRHILDDANLEINHDVINYKNGLYDLINRKFIEHTADIFTINQLNIDYIEDISPNEEVDKFLEDICNGDANRKKALLQILGYCLTTRNNIQKFVLLYGPKGSNGKSFTLKVVEEIVGKENISHKGMELLAEDFEVKGIDGKQLNISFELPVTKIKDTSVLKATTTGDTIETKVKFNPDTLSITSYIKHLFATNYLPEVSDKTNGFYRRIHIIPFERQFDAKDNTFSEESFLNKNNLNYLGKRALDEYLKMLDSGKLEFANEKESNKYVREFENLNDTVKAFITQEELFPENVPILLLRPQFWTMYGTYCDENNGKKVGKRQFYTELTTKYGFNVKVLNGEYYLSRNPKTK